MMVNNSSPDAKRPRTDAGGVAGPGGDVRKMGSNVVVTAGASPLSAPPQTTAVNGGRGYAGAKKPMFLRVRVSENRIHTVLCTGNIFFVEYYHNIQFYDQYNTQNNFILGTGCLLYTSDAADE